MKKSLIGLALACAAVVAQADAPTLRFFGSVGYAVGGDPVLSGTWLPSGEPWNLRAGRGGTLALGGDVRLSDRFAIQGSMGYHRDSIDGADASFEFSRVPLELLGFYSMTEQFRLGLGVRKSQSAKMQGGGTYEGLHKAYESSTGAVVEGQYLFGAPSKSDRQPVIGMYLRYVNESFKAKDASWDTRKRDGSHVALGLMFYY